jgi:hypothetical protein
VFDLAFFTVCITATWPMISESAEALADTCTGVGCRKVNSALVFLDGGIRFLGTWCKNLRGAWLLSYPRRREDAPRETIGTR